MRTRGMDGGGTPRNSSRTRRVASLGAVVAAGIFTVLTAHTAVAAQPLAGASASEGAPAPGRYKGTRRIVVDKQTRQLRMPTTEEVGQLVVDLARLTKRSTENLPETEIPGGGTSVDLEGGFGGVMLARPNDDGTYETKCVFTFSEGAEFLGLVREERGGMGR